MTVGEKIRNIRKTKGLTQEQLGIRCGIKAANIRKYELDKAHPKYETLQRIAGALEVSVFDLLPLPDPHEVEMYGYFESYLKAIGYMVATHVTKSCKDEIDNEDNEPVIFLREDESEIIISKDGYSVTLTEDEFIDLGTRTEEYIEMQFNNLLIKKK